LKVKINTPFYKKGKKRSTERENKNEKQISAENGGMLFLFWVDDAVFSWDGIELI